MMQFAFHQYRDEVNVCGDGDSFMQSTATFSPVLITLPGDKHMFMTCWSSFVQLSTAFSSKVGLLLLLLLHYYSPTSRNCCSHILRL